MRVWVVGSGTLRPDPMRGAPAYWLEAGGRRVLMDCGAGTLRTLARLGLPWAEVDILLVSHLHTDHVGELAPLLFALRHGLERGRKAPLRVLGPSGLDEHLHLLSRAHGSFVREPGFPLDVVELGGEARWRDPGGGLFLRTRRTLHTPSSLAFRIEEGEASLGYSGDTGPESGLGDFFAGCQVVVAECSHPDGAGIDTHLTPGGLARLATEARPGLLVTVHAYPPLDPERVPDLLAVEGYRGEVRAGRDGMLICLEGNTLRVVESESALSNPQGEVPLSHGER